MTGDLAYSAFQQGAGRVHAWDAVFSTEAGCANLGLDVTSDLDGTEHHAGPARLNSDGEFYVGGAGYPWDGFYYDGNGDSIEFVDGSAWIDGVPWIGGMPWIDGVAWAGGVPWVAHFCICLSLIIKFMLRVGPAYFRMV